MLSHLKVLDFSTLLPGPYASMILADLGAEVLRIEAPAREDLTRSIPPLDENVSAVHKQLNRSKKSLALDLKQPESIEIVKELIMEYDVLLEQFRPGVMERLGLGYEELRKINPKLIYCSITGYGQTGAYRNRAGHDINYLALSGTMGYSGTKEHGPSLMGIQIADVAGGSLHSVIGILSAVIHRGRTGIGQHIDVSMTDCTFALNALFGAGYVAKGLEPEPESTLLNGGTFYDFYETKDGRYFSVGSLEPPFRKALCQAINRPELIPLSFSDEQRDIQAFKSIVKESFLTKTFTEWVEIFDKMDACVEPVLRFSEACEHPVLQERGMIVDVPNGNGKSLNQMAHPIKYSHYQPKYQHTGSQLGEHSTEILQKLGNV